MTVDLDARIQRTHDLLLGALTQQLNEKTFDEVKVKDLCEAAGIHRSTFYAHFEDKSHLLTFGIQTLMDELVLICPGRFDPRIFARFIYRTFKFFRNNRRAYALLLLEPRNAVARQLLHAEFVRSFKDGIRAVAPDDSPAELTLKSEYLIGALLGVVAQWLSEGAQTPAHEMARQFTDLASTPFCPRRSVQPPEAI